jgi:fluoride exporter
MQWMLVGVGAALGGMLMGLVMGWSSQISPEWRWFLATGFLGGLTTFSTFSAETVTLLQMGRWEWAGALVLLHVLTTLLATGLGWWLAQAASVS